MHDISLCVQNTWARISKHKNVAVCAHMYIDVNFKNNRVVN